MEDFKVPNYIASAIPFFFLFIFIELAISLYTRRKLMRLNDSLNDLSMGIFQQVLGIFYRGFLLAAYIFIYEFAPFKTSPDQVWVWVAGFFLVDLQYYWFHRKSHEVSVIWGSHEPHHQSEEYNLTVALRQGAIQGIFSAPFYWPLAIIGLHPLVFIVNSQFNTLYQFWIHTRTIGKLGFLEKIINTPSNHRVHHGKNPKYIDRNHGGTLIIWDIIFGTYQSEEEEPVYGTVKPLASWNPLWANLQYWLYLFRLSAKADSFSDRVKIWFKPPGWKPESLGGQEQVPEVSAADFIRYDPPVSAWWQGYGLLQFIIAISGTLLLIFKFSVEDPFSLLTIGGAFVVLYNLIAVGFIFEQRERLFAFELVRIIISFAVMVSLYAGLSATALYAVGGISALSLTALFATANLSRLQSLKADGLT